MSAAALGFLALGILCGTPAPVSAAPGGSYHLRAASKYSAEKLPPEKDASGQIASDAEDPLAFLETDANCSLVSRTIDERYGKPAQRARLSPLLREEFRHVSAATCGKARFAACRFDWCSAVARKGADENTAFAENKAVAEPARIVNDQVIEREVRNSETLLTASRAADSNVVNSRVAQDTARARLASRSDGASDSDVAAHSDGLRAGESRGTSLHGTKEQGVPKDPAAKVRTAKAEPAVLSADQALEKLAVLLKEKEARIQKQIAQKKAEENKLGLEWRQFSVPGGFRPPRERFASTEKNGGEKGDAGDTQDQIAQLNAPRPAAGGANPAFGSGQIGNVANHVGPVGAGGLRLGGLNPMQQRVEDLRVKDPSQTQAENKFLQMFMKDKVARARLGAGAQTGTTPGE